MRIEMNEDIMTIEHDCLVVLEKNLSSKNTQLVCMKSTSGTILPLLWTERIENLRDGKKPEKVICRFCPFCGQNLEQSPVIEQSNNIRQQNRADEGLLPG